MFENVLYQFRKGDFIMFDEIAKSTLEFPFPDLIYLLITTLIYTGLHGSSATVWHAYRERLLPQTPSPVPFRDVHMFYLLRPILFTNLSLFCRTMHFEHPSVFSQICLMSDDFKCSLPYPCPRSLYEIRAAHRIKHS